MYVLFVDVDVVGVEYELDNIRFGVLDLVGDVVFCNIVCLLVWVVFVVGVKVCWFWVFFLEIVYVFDKVDVVC